jgi:hypothetical protein
VVTVAVVVALLVLMGCAALALDRVWLNNARRELQAGADAAALAAARRLACDARLHDEADWTGTLADARRDAGRIARRNMVAGRPVALDVAEHGDVRFGSLVQPDGGAVKFLELSHAPTTAVVIARCERRRNNPVARLLGGATRQPFADVVARAEASIDNHVVGLRPVAGAAVPLMPLAIARLDAGASECWFHMIELNQGGDAWRYDPDTREVTAGPDGLPEIVLRGVGADGDASEANLRLIDLNTGLWEDALNEQITQGCRPEAFDELGGMLLVGNDPVELPCTAELDGDVAAALDSMTGRCRACLLYENATGDDAGCGSLQISGLVAGRVMAVRTGTDGTPEIVFQPGVLATRCAVLAPQAAANRYIYKLHLTH